MVAIPLDAERVQGRPSQEVVRRSSVAVTLVHGHPGIHAASAAFPPSVR